MNKNINFFQKYNFTDPKLQKGSVDTCSWIWVRIKIKIKTKRIKTIYIRIKSNEKFSASKKLNPNIKWSDSVWLSFFWKTHKKVFWKMFHFVYMFICVLSNIEPYWLSFYGQKHCYLKKNFLWHSIEETKSGLEQHHFQWTISLNLQQACIPVICAYICLQPEINTRCQSYNVSLVGHRKHICNVEPVDVFQQHTEQRQIQRSQASLLTL